MKILTIPNRVIRLSVAVVLLLIAAHRLPAPIQEAPDSPTPAPDQSARPKPRFSARAKSQSASEEKTSKQRTIVKSTPTPAALFAGTWVGRLSDGRTRTIFINPSQTTVTIDGGLWGRETGIVEAASGSQLSWTTTLVSVHVKWTFNLLQGGKTAQVNTKHFPGGESGAFEKRQ